jgi:hypothetical protein
MSPYKKKRLKRCHGRSISPSLPTTGSNIYKPAITYASVIGPSWVSGTLQVSCIRVSCERRPSLLAFDCSVAGGRYLMMDMYGGILAAWPWIIDRNEVLLHRQAQVRLLASTSAWILVNLFGIPDLVWAGDVRADMHSIHYSIENTSLSNVTRTKWFGQKRTNGP